MGSCSLLFTLFQSSLAKINVLNQGVVHIHCKSFLHRVGLLFVYDFYKHLNLYTFLFLSTVCPIFTTLSEGGFRIHCL